MKPTKKIIDIYLGILSNLDEKLEYLYEQERKIKESAKNPLWNGLSSKDKTLLDTVQAKIKRFKKELESNELKSNENPFQSSKPHQDEVYRRYWELRDSPKFDGVKPSFFRLKEELENAGWNPEEFTLKDEPYHFNKNANNWKTRENEKSTSRN